MSDENRRIENDVDGSVKTYNNNNNLHSFNDKPACIHHDGTVSWYDNGYLFKTMLSNGMILIYNRYGVVTEMINPDGERALYAVKN